MRKLISLVLVLLLSLALFPAAFAGDVHDDNCEYIPANPCILGCVGKHAAGCDYTPGRPCTCKKAPDPTPVPHVCSFGIFESNGDGTHTAICSGNYFHRVTERCYSDNNRNHKCDHCAGVMSKHEFSYVAEGAYSHKASCYCGEVYIEPCSFVDDRCEKCENICRIYSIDGKVLDELNSGSSYSLSADGLNLDMLNIDYGSDESFRAEISQPVLDKIRSENPDINISVGNDSFSMMMGSAFLASLDEGAYVDRKTTDDGFALELGSGDRMLAELDIKGIASHWGTSSLRCQLDCAPSDIPGEGTQFFSLGVLGGDGMLSPVDGKLLWLEKELNKSISRLNTVDYPYAKTEYDQAFSAFSKLELPTANLRFTSLGTSEAFISGSEGSSYTLAPDDEGCYEASMLLAPGREIGVDIPTLSVDFKF